MQETMEAERQAPAAPQKAKAASGGPMAAFTGIAAAAGNAAMAQFMKTGRKPGEHSEKPGKQGQKNGFAKGHPGHVGTRAKPLTVRSGPSTRAEKIGSLAKGTPVQIVAQTSGSRVSGTYGTSTIWNQLSTGGWIADAYTYTGTDGWLPGLRKGGHGDDGPGRGDDKDDKKGDDHGPKDKGDKGKDGGGKDDKQGPVPSGRYAELLQDPYKRVEFRGHTFNQRTKAMLLEVERLIGHQLDISQGSYNAGGVKASAGTHDGGGAVDISSTSIEICTAMRRVGFAAWRRGVDYNDSFTNNQHIHGVAIGDKELASVARQQIGAYYDGRDGLVGNHRDMGPQVPKMSFEEYLKTHQG